MIPDPRKLFLMTLLFSLYFYSFCFSDESMKLIERVDFTKKMKVKELLKKNKEKLSNYRTFSFYVQKKLIFCHISLDKSEPKVICY